MDSSIDETKLNLKLIPPQYTNKQEYVGGTNEKTHVILRGMNLKIFEVILMAVQKIFMMNTKMKKMTISLTIHLKLII